MSRFVGFEDRALDRRLQRLRRSELDLRERIRTQAAEAERSGRYAAADPAYRRLAVILRTLRWELHETAREQVRRVSRAQPRPGSPAGHAALATRGRTSDAAGPKT